MDVINLPMGMRRALQCDTESKVEQSTSSDEIAQQTEAFLRNGGTVEIIPAPWELRGKRKHSQTSKSVNTPAEKNSSTNEPEFVTGGRALTILRIGYKRFKQLIKSAELKPDHFDKHNHPRFSVAVLKALRAQLGNKK